MRIVVSLTTIPSRTSLLGDVVESIMAQTVRPDEIALNIPYMCLKEESGYRLDLSLPIKVYEDNRDWGPGMKLLPTLKRETDPETLVITVDDDIIYSPRTIETLLSGAEAKPDAVIGLMGVKDEVFVHSENLVEMEEVDGVGGYRGVCYRRRLVRNNVWYDFMSVCCMAGCLILDDDMFINRYLRREGVPRYVAPGMVKTSRKEVNLEFIDFKKSSSIYRGDNDDSKDSLGRSKGAIKRYYGF